jgi:hypothetical protein
MILRSALNYAGRLYEAGDNVTGQLPLDMIRALQANGVLEAPASSSEQVDKAAGNVPAAVSAAEFGQMAAEEQKKLLESLGLEPSSNKEKRQEQYEQWLSDHPASQ